MANTTTNTTCDAAPEATEPNENVVVTTYNHHLTVHHFRQEPIRSTQDEARRLLHEQQQSSQQQSPQQQQQQQHDNNNNHDSPTFLAVIADQQTAGRGTNGRSWEGAPGNLYLTLCLPFDSIPVMPTLLPLQIAVLVAEQAAQALAACQTQEQVQQQGSEHGQNTNNNNNNNANAKVTVKWPNDVLINQNKLSGTLIESEIVQGTTWLLIGIGTNIRQAPSLSHSPGKNPRASTCIQEYCDATLQRPDKDSHNNKNHPILMDAYSFGVHLAQRLVDWVVVEPRRIRNKAQREQRVIERWKQYAEFGTLYEMRGTVQEESKGQYQGEQVQTVNVRYDGQLVVRGQDGRERLLVADYMF